MEVLKFINFGAYRGNQEKVTLAKDYKYIIVDISKVTQTGFNGAGNYDFIHSIVPSRTAIASDTKFHNAYGREIQSFLKVYEDCKQGDVIEAGALSGTCVNVTIIGIE